MIVVADTSPLNYLIRLGYAEILRRIYGQVLVPSAVLIEMQHLSAPSEVRAWALAPPQWVEQTTMIELDPSLSDKLGAGERAAISLALARRADVLLIDDLAGRHEAKARHVNVAGTLAVLYRLQYRDI